MNYVFLTGASGFLGRHIAEKFIAENWHVVALIHNNRSNELKWIAKSNMFTEINGDICDTEELGKKLLEFTSANKIKLKAVVHCAAYVSDVGRKKKFKENNYLATKKIGAMAKFFDVDKFVFISTTDVYGIKDFNDEREDELPYCNNRKNNYPKYKIYSEQWIRANFPQDNYAIVRPAAVWGVNDKTLTLRIVDFLKWSPCMIHFGKWRGKNRWPLAHVKNVATATYLAATEKTALGKTINVLDKEKVSIDDFYSALASIFFPNKKFLRVYIPTLVITPLTKLITFISNVFDLKKPFIDPSHYALHSVSSNLDFSNAFFVKLTEQAGHKIITYQEGLDELRTHNLKQ